MQLRCVMNKHNLVGVKAQEPKKIAHPDKSLIVVRPAQEPIDYAKLRKRTRSRYPKILAHLAK